MTFESPVGDVHLPGHAFSVVGSWPGTLPSEMSPQIVGLLAERAGAMAAIPAIVELPHRGPAAQIWGRGAGTLVDIGLDLECDGWRVTSKPSAEQRLARALLAEDLEAFALAVLSEGSSSGWVKMQSCGPWTLGAGLRLGALGDGLADHGLMADVVASLGEGIRAQLDQLRKLLPGIRIIQQIDEPALAAVASGSVPTATGRSTIAAIDPERVASGLATLADGARAGGADHIVVHSCSDEFPWQVLGSAQIDGIGFPLRAGISDPRWWESVAAAIESGTVLWAGMDPFVRQEDVADYLSRALFGPWRDVGLESSRLREVVITPECGLPAIGSRDIRSTVGKLSDYCEIVSEYSQGS